MAARYWVGGTASWDGTAGTKWAATSGGAGGETVPTTADDVYFDGVSTGTVTIATGNTGAKSITCTGFTGTITGSASISVAGSVTLSAGMTYSHSGTVTITGTGTLITAGKTFSALTVNGVGIVLTLGDALTAPSRAINITSGTFDTAGYAVSAQSITSSGSLARTILLQSSSVTLSITGAAVNFTTASNLTFDAGTSQITLSGASASLFGGGQTFYNVAFSNTSTGTRSISDGGNTFNGLSINLGAGLSLFTFGGAQTINGTLTCVGTSIGTRCGLFSNLVGTARTITANAISADYCDFRDITLSGAAAGATPAYAGDCGNNTGINFPSPKTVYRVGSGTVWGFGAADWALTSGGTPSALNFPLAQDTAIVDNNCTPSGTLSVGFYSMGRIDFSNRTNAIAININSFIVYDSFILSSSVTVSGAAAVTFSGRGTQTFTPNGASTTFPIAVEKPLGTFQLGSALLSSSTLTFTQGTIDAKNYNVTCSSFASGVSNTRTLLMGSGLWTLSGLGSIWNVISTGLTLNKGTADILLSHSGTTARTFTGGAQSYNKLTIGGSTGTSTLTISGANTFTELASTKTVAHTISLSSDQTVGTWSIKGTSGNTVTVVSNSAGTRRTISLANQTSGIDYLSVKDIGVSVAGRFYVGANSFNGGNNLNVYFTDGPSEATGSMFMLFN